MEPAPSVGKVFFPLDEELGLSSSDLTPHAQEGLDGVLHRLKHDGPERVLLHLALLCQRCSTPEVRSKWQYLLHRHSQMQYPLYQAAGWPIGSGMVESANKLVVEARLKGTDMHWKRENVNPMLLLRNAVCNDRWNEAWQRCLKQAQRHRQQKRQRHRQQKRQRHRQQKRDTSA